MCADDVGSALDSITHLHEFKLIFGCIPKLAGQTLKPVKMFIIPLCFDCFETTKQLFQDWIIANIPDLEQVKVVTHGVHLGVAMGPSSAQHMFVKTIQQWWHRVQLISLAGTPTATTILAYNVHAFS